MIQRVSWLTVLLVGASSLQPMPAFAEEEAAPDEVEKAPPEEATPSDPASPADPAPPKGEEAPDQDESKKASEPAPQEAEAEVDAADAEMAEQELAELETVDMARAPPKGRGAIVGVITDNKFDEAIIEGRIQVIGQKAEVFTDEEGRFRLELPPGTYAIRVSYELHQPTRVDGIRVTQGKIVRIDAKLTPDESAVETVVVEEEADKTSLEGQSLERKRSAVASDGVGRAEIARTPDRNAAEAARRVVGATIVDGRFVFVRGLGERYTNALLNGTPLPSPEPDRQTVPLDLFPSLVLDSVTITKQFTPDMPADFAGGSVRIHTREFPRETLFQLSLSGGYNTEATFRNRLAYNGSNTDFLGFDSGVRTLPEDIPSTKLDNRADEAERITWGRRLNSYMSTTEKGTPPNHGISAVVGESFKLGSEQKLGAVAALNYGRSFELRHNTIRNYTLIAPPGGGAGLRVQDSFSGVRGIENVRWGAFASVAFEASSNHKLVLTGLHSQAADDSASEVEGTFDTNPGVFRATHLEYVSRALNFVQLRGAHTFPSLKGAEIEWHGAVAEATRDQPDTRDVRYIRQSATDSRGAGYLWAAGPQSGFHFFQDQAEIRLSAGLDITQPLFGGEDTLTKLKVGGLITTRERDSSARRFVYDQPRTIAPAFDDARFCAGAAWDAACADRLFRNDNLGTSGLMLREATIPFDEYRAGLDVYAGYGMLDSQITKTFRAVGGVRVEKTDQDFEAYDPFDRENTKLESGIESTDILPALSLVFTADKKSNTRFGISQTLARPQLREITPFLSSSYTADYPVQGNEKLKLTKVINADIRFEHFPTLRQVLAFSFFYKHFTDPIEEVILPGSQPGTLSYANADSASLIGVELESRKTLDFIAALEDFMVIANLTLARSRVELGRGGGSVTQTSRPLSYQSEYVLNVSLDYGNDDTGTNVRALYNIYGPRIVAVGAQGIPDTYEQPRNVVDLSVAQKIAKHFELKLTGQNLLGAPVVLAHRGARLYRRETQADGSELVTFAGKDPVTRRYQPGTTVTLSAQYTY